MEEKKNKETDNKNNEFNPDSIKILLQELKPYAELFNSTSESRNITLK